MSRNHDQSRRGVTLVELIVAITIVALLSASVAVLLTGAGHMNQYVTTETNAMAQVENAYRRIMHNLRAASAMSSPATTTATNTFTISTQPDPSFSNAAATVTYSISNGNLVETDSRYASGGTTIVSGVQTFSVQRFSLTAPTQVTITITSSSVPPVTRTATFVCRNF